uniref:Uncharacterized protein n=1 Tax=Rhizophora mucronata TaxID=61149 RepID=A0A2P2LSW6_RHIMU
MTEQKWVRHSFSHTPGKKVTIASPSPAGEPPGQGGVGQPSTLKIHFILKNRSPRPASSLSRLTLPRGNKGWNYSCQKKGTYLSS